MSAEPRRPWLPPLWARWVLAAIVAVSAIVAIVIAVNRAGPEGATTEAGAEAETNRIADIAITEDEAPHRASLPGGVAPVSALEEAIAGDVRHRIAGGQLTGPLDGVDCRASGPGKAGREPYSCTARSADVAYPFLAIVDQEGRRLTWCKIDPPPVANVGPEIPISASCKV